MTQLEALRIWCEAKIDMLTPNLERKLISKHRKEQIKGRIIGYDEIIGQIRKLEQGKRTAYITTIDLCIIRSKVKNLYGTEEEITDEYDKGFDRGWDCALDEVLEILKNFEMKNKI